MNTKDKELFRKFKVIATDIFSEWRKHSRDELFLVKFLTILIYARKEKCLVPLSAKPLPENDSNIDIRKLNENSGMKDVHMSILRHISNNENCIDDGRLYDIFTSVIIQLSDFFLPRQGGFLNGNEFVDYVDCLLELDDDTEYSHFLDYLFESYRHKEGECREESVQYPVEILELVLSLLNVQEGDKLCHNFAGTDSLLNVLPKNISYISEEKDVKLSDLAYLRACILDIDNVEFQNRDSLQKVVSGDIFEDGMYHLITPSFEESGYCDLYDNLNRIERNYVQKPYLQALTGMLNNATCPSCIIVPAYILCSDDSDCSYLRWAFGGENLKRTIILLPPHLFGNNPLQTALIFEESDKVTDKPMFQFVDASHCFVIDECGRKRLNLEEVLSIIREQNSDYSITVDWDNDDKDTHNLWDPRIYFPMKELNLISLINGEHQNGIEEVNKEGLSGPFVTSKELSESIYHIINANNVPVCEIPVGCIEITSCGLLVSKSRRGLRPTRIEASLDSPVYINSDILYLALSRKYIDINPLYLAYKLSEADPYELFPGGIDSDISMPELLFASIEMSDINKQDEVAETLEREHEKAKARETQLNERIEKMRTEYINEVRMRKHDMKASIENLKNSHTLLKYYFAQSKIEENLASKIEKRLDSMYKSIISLSESLNRLSEEDKFGEPEEVNLDEFLYEVAESYECATNFKVEYNINVTDLKNNKAPIVSININDLQCVCDNIINNARIHGFVDKKRTDYAIQINLSVDSDTNQCIIDFCNNGLEFPDGLTEERYGLKGEKAGPTGNTGIGGYRVKSITRHFNGNFKIIKRPGIMPNVIRIFLPIIE